MPAAIDETEQWTEVLNNAAKSWPISFRTWGSALDAGQVWVQVWTQFDWVKSKCLVVRVYILAAWGTKVDYLKIGVRLRNKDNQDVGDEPLGSGEVEFKVPEKGEYCLEFYVRRPRDLAA